MSALSKIAKATPTKGGNNIKDGNYTYLVEQITYDERGHNGATFVAEFRVIAAEANGATDEPKKGMVGKPVVPNQVGTSCSLVCLLDKHDNAGGNAKAFLLAALAPLGYKEEEITEELIREVSGPNNPLRGIIIRNETFRKWNQGRANIANRDTPLTINGWKSIEQTTADLQQRRAWLDANAATVPMAASSTPAPAAQPAPVQAVATPEPTPAPQPASVAQPTPAAPVAGSMLSRLGIK